MPYTNANWVNECKKAVGEALSVRANIRLNDAGNYIYAPMFMMEQYIITDPADENSYGDIPTTAYTYQDVWVRSGTTLENSKTLPSIDSYRSGVIYPKYCQSTGDTQADSIRFHCDEGLFVGRDSLIFSIHATPYDAGTYNGGAKSDRFSIGFVNRTLDENVVYSATWEWNAITHLPVFISASTEIEAYGTEWIEDYSTEAFWKFHIGINLPSNQSGDAWSVTFHPNGDNINNGYSIVAAPQLEVANLLDRQEPATFIPEQIYSQPGTLITLSGDDYTIISLNPVVQKRERDYGVVQGQNTVVSITNPNASLLSYYLEGCWANLEAGFEELDEWEVICQGQIHNSNATSDLVLNFSLDDSLVRVLEYKLPRDYTFNVRKDAPYSGEVGVTDILTVTKSDESEDYDNEYAYSDGTTARVVVIAGQESKITDHTYTIEFVSNDLFRVRFEDGTYWLDSTTYLPEYFSIASDATFGTKEQSSTDILTIKYEGWSQEAGKYTAGDTYEFTTTAIRTETQLTPIGMLRHLIEDVVGLKVYSVEGGSYGSPFTFVNTSMNNYIDDKQLGTHYVAGYFPKGTPVIDMVQDLLKISNASIYPLEDGQIGFWAIDMDRLTTTTAVNGNPDRVDASDIDDGIEILDITHSRTTDRFANAINLKYLDINLSNEATYTIESGLPEDLTVYKNVEVKWEIPKITAIYCAGVLLSRFNGQTNIINMETTLSPGAQLDLDKSMSVYDQMVNLNGLTVEVTERSINPLSQTFILNGYDEPYYTLKWARVDVHNCDDPDRVVR